MLAIVVAIVVWVMGGWEQVEEVVLAMVIATIVVRVRDVGGWVGGSKLRWAEACLHPHQFFTRMVGTM